MLKKIFLCFCVFVTTSAWGADLRMTPERFIELLQKDFPEEIKKVKILTPKYTSSDNKHIFVSTIQYSIKHHSYIYLVGEITDTKTKKMKDVVLMMGSDLRPDDPVDDPEELFQTGKLYGNIAAAFINSWAPNEKKYLELLSMYLETVAKALKADMEEKQSVEVGNFLEMEFILNTKKGSYIAVRLYPMEDCFASDLLFNLEWNDSQKTVNKKMQNSGFTYIDSDFDSQRYENKSGYLSCNTIFKDNKLVRIIISNGIFSENQDANDLFDMSLKRLNGIYGEPTNTIIDSSTAIRIFWEIKETNIALTKVDNMVLLFYDQAAE